MKNLINRKNFIIKIILSISAFFIGLATLNKFNSKKNVQKNIITKINPLAVKRVNKV